MKKYIKGIALIGLLIGSYSLSLAQDCEGYYPMTEGIQFETKNYDKKNRLKSTNQHVVKEVFEKDGQTIAVVHTITTDDKGEELINTQYEVVCEGGNITVNTLKILKEKLTATLSENDSDAEANVTGTNSVMPNNMRVGQELPDSTMEMEIMAGSVKMDFGVKSFNKKVVAEETINVPAGTYDCMVVTEHTETKMMITKKTTSKLWYAKGVGLVKQEEYNKKGDLVGLTVLTNFKD
ncbi:hypothetical protein SAMN04487906_2164 [Zhouia amylolytica]|uniref:DUF3108 domain-containing protein n=1 Tax=Zhouia amylolytica TaxID=376730 RepID=A0A1I6TVF7_9FLAO|nr:hypothetical protein [Zhouia amylolytica]MCQ0112554.1 hypothetical protein [Zhouia amylolytica]SFS92987.1 hypothetical protein SAMN04487906_2164 [Zhouia amylolytica]